MLDDFVGESPTTGFSGTGPFTLAGAIAPFTKKFRDARHGANGSQWLACARTTSSQPSANGTKYMVFAGTLTYGSPDQLSVDTVFASSAGYGTAVSWLSTDVFVVYAAPALEALAGLIQNDVDRGTATTTITLADNGSVNHCNVSAANRTLNLPAGSTVNRFFRVGVNGYGHASNYVAVTPNGTDTISGVNSAVNVVGRAGTKWFRWSTVRSDWVLE